jgi:hypothetical protein
VTAADFTLAVAVRTSFGAVAGADGAIADRFGLRTTMAGAAIYVVGPGVMAAPLWTTGLLVSGGLIQTLSCTASRWG